MFQHEGHWFPDGIKPTTAPHAIKRRDAAFQQMARYFPNISDRRVCVTAGGMTGLWPLHYLKYSFEVVYTFEPAPHVWECFERNCRDQMRDGSIRAVNAALGDARGVMGIRPNSVGSSYLEPAGAASDLALVSLHRLDDLDLKRVDWLQYDLEGFELKALRGSEQTLRRCRPRVQLEVRDLGRRYGETPDDLHDFMRGLGYTRYADIVGGDELWIP